MIRKILKVLATVILSVLCLTSVMQAFTVIYDFPPTAPFEGDSIINPYREVDSLNWRKANFHAHQRWFFGATSAGYSEEEFINAYREQKYDIIGLSDHQYINPYGHFPTYEHGWGVNNFHILMLGARDRSWFDYPMMWMPKHQMQYQFDKFAKQAKLTVLNHPYRLRHASREAYREIRGYDLMEMNSMMNAESWDMALSSGIHSYLIADDDAHTSDDRESSFQRCYTMVNTKSLQEDDILEALKAGRAYGVAISTERNTAPRPHDSLPTITSIGLQGADTMFVRFSLMADSVRFIGQNGAVVASVLASDSAECVIRPEDSYVRVMAYFPRGTQLWTNPLCRVNPGEVIECESPQTNILFTVLNSISWSVLSILILVLIWIMNKNSKKKRKFNRRYESV